MASSNILTSCLLSLLATLLGVSAFDVFVKSGDMYSFNCSDKIQSCSASLYHVNTGIPEEEVASLYSVNSSQIKPISHGSSQDYLIKVPCSCQNINGTRGYFYNTLYKVKEGDSFVNVSAQDYNGQAWEVGDEERNFIPGHNVSIRLLCGCVEIDSQTVVTYTVQQHDTLSDIANLLSASVDDIQSMNSILIQNPESIDVGWVLFVPMNQNGQNGLPAPEFDTESGSGSGRKHKWTIVIITLLAVAILSITSLVIILVRRKRSQHISEEDARAVSKSLSASRAASLQQFYRDNMEDVTDLESDRPIIYNLEEIEEGTSNFDESKKLGEGGYGSVYFGVLEGQEVAIKKMRSNKSREFFAELKVLCKVHHINVVELLGYSSGEEHFYLVYEYVRNGSLSDHLHDPQLKGYQPLSWTARAQIALDAAKGIEYIHDHTKARYVHRDIKTSNILLDEGLRAKVADFGLAKLVERSNEDDLVATRLVGTPGYLPPESVKELQVTTKTDVFAFGVVLAELITGQRALVRDKREPTKLKSLINLIYKIYDDEDPESALEDVIDMNLRGSYPLENVFKMAEVSGWCLNEDPIDRPEMRDIVGTLSQIMVSSVEWEASLGGSSQVFSGLNDGR